MELAIWFGFAVACALVAEKKNRSIAGWFVWGLLGGIFALGILLLMPTLNIETAANVIYKKCPYCAEQILFEARICKHCGREL